MAFDWLIFSFRPSAGHFIGTYSSILLNNSVLFAKNCFQTNLIPYYWYIYPHSDRNRYIILGLGRTGSVFSIMYSLHSRIIYHFAVYIYIVARINWVMCFAICLFAYRDRYMLGNNVI